MIFGIFYILGSFIYIIRADGASTDNADGPGVIRERVGPRACTGNQYFNYFVFHISTFPQTGGR